MGGSAVNPTLEALVAQLEAPDPDTRALALGNLEKRGAAAVPALCGALHHTNADVRALAAEGLAQIGEAAGCAALRAALDDVDERVRSQAATGLALAGDPLGIAALISTLNDNPDLLRAHLSLSAYTLMGLGRPALEAVAPLLASGDERSRVKAIWIVRQIAESMPDQTGWKAVAGALAEYDPKGRAAEQLATAHLLSTWLQAHPPAD